MQYSSTSSSGGESSCDEGRRRHGRRGVRGMRVTNALQQSDPEYISSSEQSCDTVIYCGPDGSALSDRDLTDNEGPPSSVPIWRPPDLDSDSPDGEEEENKLEALKEEDEEDDSDKREDQEMEEVGAKTENKTETTIDDPAVDESSDSVSSGSPQKQSAKSSPKQSSGLPVPVQKSSPAKAKSASPVRRSPKTNGSLTSLVASSTSESAAKASKTPPLDSPPSIERPKDLPSGLEPSDHQSSSEAAKQSLLPKPKVPPRTTSGLSTISAGMQRAQQLEMEQGQNHMYDEDEYEEEVQTDENREEETGEDVEHPEVQRSDRLSTIIEQSSVEDSKSEKSPSPLKTDDADAILGKLKCMDQSLFSQLQAVQPETPGSESIKDAEMLLGLTSTEAKHMMEQTLKSLAAEYKDNSMHSVSSYDNISGLLGKPMSEISEDELSLAFSEQETLSFVSRDTDVESFNSDNFTGDDLPMGIEAISCIRELEKRSIDSYSENPSLSLSFNGASVKGCINEPNLLLNDREERNRLTTQSISHYVYSDDESEAGDRDRRKRLCGQVSDIETFDSVSLASHDLEAIKSMYVISSLNMDSLGLLDDENDQSKKSNVPPMNLAEALSFLQDYQDEPSVVTYMTINNDEQVVMREKHLAIDHPLRRLSCISDATDATFSTASRPASYMDLGNDDEALTDADLSPDLYTSNGYNGAPNLNMTYPCVSQSSPLSDHVFDVTQLYHKGDVVDYQQNKQNGVTFMPGVTTDVPNGIVPTTSTRTLNVASASQYSPVWEKMDANTQAACQHVSTSNGPKTTPCKRTISHLDTDVILPNGGVNKIIPRSCQSSPARKVQVSEQENGEAVSKLLSTDLLRRDSNSSSVPSQQPSIASTTTTQLLEQSESKCNMLQESHLSKSGPASFYNSPQHKTKPSSAGRTRSLSHQPSPLILSAAIARAKKQIEYTQEDQDVDGFYDPNVPNPEMWRLRQPDGAPDNETDECFTTPHTNTPAYYQTIEECKEPDTMHGMSSMERPPAIGACAAPAFEVEVNPCFSHEYDEVLKSNSFQTPGHNVIVQHCMQQLGEPCTGHHDQFGHLPSSPKSRPLPQLPEEDCRNYHRQAQCSVSDSEYCRVPIMSCQYGGRRTDKAPRQYASDSEFSRVPGSYGIRVNRSDSYGHANSKNSSGRLPYKSNSTNSINTHARCSASSSGGGKPAHKKVPQTTSKLPYPSKTCPGKKSKSRLPSSSHSDQSLMRNANNNTLQLHACNRLTHSSDGSNDSGIANTDTTPHHKHHHSTTNILSPYSTVTKPRLMRGSSSGHGSDNSSTISDCLPGSQAFKARMAGGASSGYESMLRDSEATASGSSAHDSLSEGSCGRVKGSKILKKKFPGESIDQLNLLNGICKGPNKHQTYTILDA